MPLRERGNTLPALHPALKDQNRGHAVYGLTALFNREIGLAEQAVGFGRSQSFVPKMNWQAEAFAQILRENLHLFGLRTLGTAHAQREANYDFFHRVFLDNTAKVGKIVTLIPALEGFQALGSDAERIGHRDANAARSYVEAENAAGNRVRVGGHGGIITGRWLWRSASTNGFAVGSDVLVMLFKAVGEAVVTLGIRDEVEVVALRRFHGGF